MSPVATLTSDSQTVAGPVESMLSRPAGAQLPRPGEHLGRSILEPDVLLLRPPIKAFRGQAIQDPRRPRERHFQEDEERSVISQATVLVEQHPSSKIAWARLAQTLAGAGKYSDAVDAPRAVLRPGTIEPAFRGRFR